MREEKNKKHRFSARREEKRQKQTGFLHACEETHKKYKFSSRTMLRSARGHLKRKKIFSKFSKIFYFYFRKYFLIFFQIVGNAYEIILTRFADGKRHEIVNLLQKKRLLLHI